MALLSQDNSILRQVTAWTVCLCFAVAILGVPVGFKTVNKASDTPYPCQSCNCGCSSAEQCWRNCCCFSNAEKIQWAKENSVTPPDFVIAQAIAEKQADSSDKTAAKCKSCCAGHQKSGTDRCSDQKSLNNTKSTQIADQQKCCSTTVTDLVPISVIQAQKCNGQHTDWLVLAVAIGHFSIDGFLCETTSSKFPSLAQSLPRFDQNPPDTPPPRR